MLAIVKLATRIEPLRPLDVRLGNVHAVGFESRLSQSPDDLPGAAAHIEHARAGTRRFQIVRVLSIEVGIPVREELGVGFVVAISFLMAHSERVCDLRFATCDLCFQPKNAS